MTATKNTTNKRAIMMERRRQKPTGAKQSRAKLDAYRLAASRLGYTATSVVDWTVLHRGTTFRWKRQLLRDQIAGIIKEMRERQHTHGMNKCAIAMHVVAEFFGISVHDITDQQRSGPISVPRMFGMWLAFKTGCTTGAIALVFNKDASSVRYGVKRAQQIIEKELGHVPSGDL